MPLFRFRWGGLLCAMLMLAALPALAQVPGDVSDDGLVTLDDVQLVEDHLLGHTTLIGDMLARADVNIDGSVDVADLELVIQLAGALEVVFTLPGGVPLTMVKIPQGSFLMGSATDGELESPSELPQHLVDIGYDFHMGKFEVTQRQ